MTAGAILIHQGTWIYRRLSDGGCGKSSQHCQRRQYIGPELAGRNHCNKTLTGKTAYRHTLSRCFSLYRIGPRFSVRRLSVAFQSLMHRRCSCAARATSSLILVSPYGSAFPQDLNWKQKLGADPIFASTVDRYLATIPALIQQLPDPSRLPTRDNWQPMSDTVGSRQRLSAFRRWRVSR